MGTEIFHAGGQTDGKVDRPNEANGIFSQLSNAPIKEMKKKAPLLCEIDTPVKMNLKRRGKFRFMLSKTEEGFVTHGATYVIIKRTSFPNDG
jgi:hypothetical protein